MLITHNQHYELVEKGEKAFIYVRSPATECENVLQSGAHHVEMLRGSSAGSQMSVSCCSGKRPPTEIISSDVSELGFLLISKKKKKRKVMSNPSSIITVCNARMR